MTQDHVFSGWNEKKIEFAPTYKYYPNSDDYYGSHNETKDKRSKAPAWLVTFHIEILFSNSIPKLL